jgi:hypothetical protein
MKELTYNELLQENRRLRHSEAILESIQNSVFSVDSDYCYMSFNTAHAQRVKEMFDHDLELGDCLLDILIIEHDRRSAQQSIDRALKGENVINSLPIGVPPLRYYYQIHHCPVKDPSGEIVGVSVVTVDLSEHKRTEEETSLVISELKDSLRENRTLERTLPICSNCHNIHNDDGQWISFEGYMTAHAKTEFSHGICPDCIRNLYPSDADAVFKELENGTNR